MKTRTGTGVEKVIQLLKRVNAKLLVFRILCYL